jgi:MFS family permease
MIKGSVLDTAEKPPAVASEEILALGHNQGWHAIVAAWLGQAFDAMNTMMYFIIMYPALSDLLHTTNATNIGWHGGLILAIFTVGWGIGSILFGMVADRVGRVKTMAGTILLYALASVLCAISTHWWDLAAYRFLVGLGVGGECSLGAVLVSECWPERKKKLWAICLMNSSWPMGALLTGVFNLWTGTLGWRFLFVMGVIPALVTFYIRATMKEPPAFQQMKAKRSQLIDDGNKPTKLEEQILLEHPLKAIFKPQYLSLTLISAALITSATVGYYASIAWMPAWINQITNTLAVQERSNATLYQSLGCLIACVFPPLFVMRWGYRGALMIGFLGSFLVPFGMFTFVHSYHSTLINMYSVGIGLFSPIPWIIMYSYLPEVYPTQLLGTGAGFAWAVGRFLTAVAGLCTGPIIAFFNGSYGAAAAIFTLTYLIGLVVAFFVREPEKLVVRTTNRDVRELAKVG